MKQIARMASADTRTWSGLGLPLRWVLVVCLWASAVRGQVAVDWVGFPRGVSLAVDDWNHVYSVDYQYALGAEMEVTKQDVNGNVLWVSGFDQTDPTRWERAAWLATDPDGNVIVVGTSMSGYSNPVPAASIVMKMAPDGTVLWRQLYESGFDGSSVWRCVVDDQGRIFVFGIGPGPSGFVSKVKAFDPSGATLWTYYDSDGIGAPVSLELAPNGDLVLVGRATVGNLNGYARISASGQRRFGLGGVPSLTVGHGTSDGSDTTYIVFADAGGGTRLQRLDLLGNLLWEAVAPLSAFRVVVGPDQSPVLCGFPNSGTAGAAFAKYDPSGNLLWFNPDADGPQSLLLHAHLIADGSNDVYLAASTLFQMAVCKVRADGTAAWTQTLPGSSAAAVARSRSDRSLFVVGGNLARLLDAEEGPWTDLGGGLGGYQGIPSLIVAGSMEPLSLVTVQLVGAAPASPGFLFVGTAAANLALAGGILIPSPELVIPIPATDAFGAWSWSEVWPQGVLSGMPFYAQVGLVDALAPFGFAGSNGWMGRAP